MYKNVLTDIRITDECAEALVGYGYRIIKLPPSDRLAPPVASHPDMIFFRYGENLICHRCYAEKYPEIIAGIGVSPILSDESWSETYPDDVLFNAALIGNRLICRRKSASKIILRTGAEIIDVPQGYAGCSTCAVGDNALITADDSIASAAGAAGIDVLKITPGHIRLPGYDTGFIGGCAGCDGNKVFFTGDVSLHPDGDRMIKFINAHGFDPVCLSDKPLTDYGKLIFIH